MNTGNSFLFGALLMAIELSLFTELGEHFFPGSLFEKRSALFLSVASLAILRRYGSMPTAILAAASLFLCLAPDLAFVPLCAVLVGFGLPVDNCLLLPASEFYVFSMMAIFVWLLAALTLFCNVSGTLRLATAFSFLWFCHRLPLVAAGTNGPTDDQIFLQLVGTTVVLGHAHNESRKRTRLDIDDKQYTPTSFDDRQITVRAFSEPPVKYTGGFATPAEDETPTSQYDSAGRPYHPKFLFLAARDATLKLLAARQLMFANQHPSVSIKAFDYVSAALAIELGLQHRSKQHHDTFVQRFTTSGVKLANVLRATAM